MMAISPIRGYPLRVLRTDNPTRHETGTSVRARADSRGHSGNDQTGDLQERRDRAWSAMHAGAGPKPPGEEGVDGRVRRRSLRERSFAAACHTGRVSCTHLGEIQVTALPDEITGCEECLKIGGWWVHLRMCEICGHIGCCDNSPNKHATAHFHETSHPIIRSAEPAEDWSWCYVDEVTLELG
jgi:Zn-finger in ubiquitin-hydrolases and other protein